MKRVGVLLVLLVLFSTLAVGAGTVRAENTGELIVIVQVFSDLGNGTGQTTMTYKLPSEASASSHVVMYEYQGDTVTLHFEASNIYDVLYYFSKNDFSTDGQSFMEIYKKYTKDIVENTLGATIKQYLGVYHSLQGVGDINAYVEYVRAFIPHSTSNNAKTVEDTINLDNASEIVVLVNDYFERNDRSYVKGIVDYGNDGSLEFNESYQGSRGLRILDGTTNTLYVYAHADDGSADHFEAAGIVFSVFILDTSVSVMHSNGAITIENITIEGYRKIVSFSLKDGLSGQSLSGVTVKENGQVLGTIDDGGTLELAKGQHTLTFEKTGYWSVTKTIDVQGDMSVSVEMYPDSAAFRLENFPADISIPENTIYTLTFTLSPIQTSATYNTYLSLSGLSDVIEVQKDGSAISPENGKYYLGDISSPVQVSIKFKAGAVGQHGFTISIESHDAIMSKTYTTTKTVTYTVEPLPFSVQMPSEWQVGQNELRISESSGQSYLITAVLKDSQGNEVWSDSHAFSPYEAHTFTVNIPSEGSYTLELTWNGRTAIYSIQVNPAITLKTKALSVEKGGEGTIVLHFKNPSSDVQYYTIKVSGGFLPAEINQSISVAPLSEKDVSIAFAVPEDLTYDAYELNVQVLQGDSVVFQDKVAVTIDSGGFTLFGSGTSTPTWAYALLGLVVLGGVIWALRRR